MRWLADECVYGDVVRELRAAGHDVIYAAEGGTQTVDQLLATQATEQHRILLTEDRDFGEIVFRDRRVLGVVYIRIRPSLWRLKWPRDQAAIAKHGEALGSRFTVVDETQIRSRLLDQR